MTVTEKFYAADEAFTATAEKYDNLVEQGEDAEDAAQEVNRCQAAYLAARDEFKRCEPAQYVAWLEAQEDYLAQSLAGLTNRIW